MKIAIYSPYLDTSGGGEKYILTLASVLAQKSEVEVLLDKHLEDIGIENIMSKINKLHDIDLSGIKFLKGPIGKGGNFFSRLKFLSNYDWFFYLTDGSLFYSTAKNNVVHFQVPFRNPPKGSWGKIELSSWNYAIYNSKFTQSIVEPLWKIQGEVIYPPVNVEIFKPLKKDNHIVSVGRFFGFLKDKKHEFLIDSFKKLVDENKLTDWSLSLAGGMSEGDKEYVDDLIKRAKGYKISFYPNASLDEMKKLYGYAKIYWHASGYNETEPEKFEHFGITIVEAMAAGCVPIVINKGGPKEILEDNSGLLWDTQDELLEKTMLLIKNPNEMANISAKGIVRSKLYSQDNFAKQIERLVYGK